VYFYPKQRMQRTPLSTFYATDAEDATANDRRRVRCICCVALFAS